MIIVTGANGHLGRAIVERLAGRLPANQLGVSVRSPERASDLRARGIGVREGDFDRPETLAAAFEGATQVMLISGRGNPDAHRAAIEAARTAGAERIVYTSQQGSSPDSLFAATRSHAAVERHLQASGVPFTVLRNGFYASSAVAMLRSALESGRLILPEDAPVSWTAHADLADAAVIALTSPERLDGISPALTGPETLDYADAAAIASDLTRRKITRITVADVDWKRTALERGMPRHAVDMTLDLFAASRRGEFTVVDPALPELLGRPTATLREVLAAELAG